MLHVMMGSLLHQFEWELPELERGVDMTEKYGLVLSMASPIHAIAKKKQQLQLALRFLFLYLHSLNRHIFSPN